LVLRPTYGVPAIFADHEYDVGPMDGVAANLILSPAGKFAFAVFSAPDKVEVDDVGSPVSVSIEMLPSDPPKMQAMIFPFTDDCNKVTLPPTIDPILATDNREQNAGTAAAWANGAPLGCVESGRVDAPASDAKPHSEKTRVTIKSDLVNGLRGRRGTGEHDVRMESE
jgi:hypothetical protein